MSTGLSYLQSENKRLHDENEQLKEELNSLREFVQILDELYRSPPQVTSDSELLPLLRHTFLQMLHLLDAPDGSLVMLDEDSNELVFMLVHGSLASDLTGYRIPADEGIAGWVVKRAQPTLVPDVRTDQRFSHMIDDAFKFRTLSIAAAPLIGSGKVYGVVEALNRPGDNPFNDHDLALLDLICRAFGERLAAIERASPDTGT